VAVRIDPEAAAGPEVIGADSFVRLDYRLDTDNGGPAHAPGEFRELTFITGRGRLLPAVERALYGRRAGQDLSLTLEPEEGFGAHSPDLVQFLSRDLLDADFDYRPGQRFKHRLGEREVAYTVREVRPEGIMADFNHPLAGQRLHFQIRIREVRPAAAAEPSSGRNDPPAGPREDRHGQPRQT
jgi:FKBP-type peptidyl-prolyl cis-trans isomerase SlyD